MLPVSCLLVLVGCLWAAPDPALEGEWREWKNTHGKEYLEGEESYRRSVWEENLRMIEEHNRQASLGKHTYRLGMNHLGDWTNEEFKQRMSCLLPDEGKTQECWNTTSFRESATQNLPKHVNWIQQGYVTRVKDQGSCGSCWAFSATGALEGLHRKKTKKLISLSEQNLIDCSRTFGNHGCKGGWRHLAFQYVINNRGLNSEADYPYTGQNGTCRYNSNAVAARCTSFRSIGKGDERTLEHAVATIGPISIAVDARSKQFQFYKSGIFASTWGGQVLNHAMLAVGYHTSEKGKKEENYWILKNSWSANWGENGYMRLVKGSNQLGVANKAIYPLL